MKRQLTSIMLFSALLVGGASTFVSCTDHESDSAYNTGISLADAIAKQKAELEDLNTALKAELNKKVNQSDYDQKVDEIEGIIKGLKSRIEQNEEAIRNLQNADFSDFVRFADLDLAIKGSKAYADELVAGLISADEVDQKLIGLISGAEVDDKIKAIEELRKEDAKAAKKITDGLANDISDLKIVVKDEAEAREKLETAFDKAFDYLINKNLNSIAINATENPVLGYYNASFLGSQLNLASSFYGTASVANQDWGIKKGDFLNNGNAGYIYVSLNPTELDPTLISDLKLVDSQGNDAKGFELGDLENTDKVLTFGVRAAETSANGFYAIPVKATDPANDDFSLEKGELKEAAKGVLSKLQHPKTSNLQLGQVATALYNSVNNKLKAYTVKATYYLYDPAEYTNENGEKVRGKFVKKTQVAPAYNVAAFAVKPLSFNFLKDNEKLNNLELPSIPTLQSIINFDSYKFNWTPIEGMGDMKTSVTLENMPDLDNITVTIGGKIAPPEVRVEDSSIKFGETELKGTADADGNVTVSLGDLEKNAKADVKVTVSDIVINPSDLTVSFDPGKKNQTFDVTIPMDSFNSIIDRINSQVGNMIGSVNGIIDDMNGYVANIDGKYIAGINNLINKFEKALKNTNTLLQPTMFYVSSNSNWNQLARVEEGASYLQLKGGKASTVFVATSYTAELLAPAYKKCISVTNKPAGATVTGVNLGKVVNGDVKKIGFEADKEGVYELTYKAVDYLGVEAVNKFYVKVVK